MKKEKIYLISIILLTVAFYTYTFMPRKFEIEGGSCYQGISAMIIRFFFKICVILNIIGIILLLKGKLNAPKILSEISLLLWSLTTFINSVDSTFEDLIIGIKYFTPFLIINILIFVAIKKQKNIVKQNEKSQ